MVHRSINSQLFLLTLKVVISTLVLISAVYSTYFMIFYDWHSPPAFSWIHDSLMTILSVLLSSVLASYLSLSFAKRLIKPLQSVAHSARKISEGQLSERVNHHHCHTIEIVRLINDFNSMAGKLEAMSDDMKNGMQLSPMNYVPRLQLFRAVCKVYGTACLRTTVGSSTC